MDFQLSKMHLLQQELYRKFAETEIKPLAKDMDEEEVYSPELLEKMQKYGFFGIPYSKEYGGYSGLYAVHGGSVQGGRQHWHHHLCTYVSLLLLHQ